MQRPGFQRSAFTLIELLIAVSILLIMVSLSVLLINTAMDGDRIRSSARQVQSALAGAKDRALRAGRDISLSNPAIAAQRGLRFIVDNPPIGNGTATVSSFIYIQSLQPWPQTSIQVPQVNVTYDLLGNPTLVVSADGSDLGWGNLLAQGLINSSSQIQVGGVGGPFRTYGIVLSNTDATQIQLSSNYLSASPATGTAPAIANASTLVYSITLGTAVLPGSQPIQLSSGITINLALSPNIPSTYASNGYFDVMFSPRGVVSGPLAASGLVSFYLESIQDVIQNPISVWQPNTNYALGKTIVPVAGSVIQFTCTVAGTSGSTAPAWPTTLGPTVTDGTITWQATYSAPALDKLICTLTTQTGNVATYPVNLTTIDPSIGIVNPYLYAKTGQTAGR